MSESPTHLDPRRFPRAVAEGVEVFPPAPPAPALSVLMPTIDWGETFECCARSVLERVAAFPDGEAELIVVFDGEMPTPPEWLRTDGIVLVSTGVRSGPAAARNRAAEVARGDVLLFVDADVEAAPDSLARIRDHFSRDPDLVAVIGAYDDQPVGAGWVSRFRNLLHHHTHVSHPGPAATFWSGFGAIRAAAFHDLGGFDVSYRHPSVEDIELGMRARAAGGCILLDPDIRCRHHKSWTLRSMIVTDIWHRAVPWTKLLLEGPEIPETLNVDRRNRAAGALACLAGGSAALAPLLGGIAPSIALATAAACLAAIGLLNRSFLALCGRRGGPAFAAASFALLVLFYLYSSVTFGVVSLLSRLGSPLRDDASERSSPTEGRPRPSAPQGWWNAAIWGLAAGLATWALAVSAIGMRHAWVGGGDLDLQQRVAEYDLFRDGHYPDRTVDRLPDGPSRTTPYPPWAIPLLAIFFEPGGMLQGRLLLELFSLAALVVMGVWAWRSSAWSAPAIAAVAATAGAGIAGNGNALAMGQFSLICMGLVAQMLLLLDRHRPIAAGVCWALAMFKPQIGFAFAPLLLRSGDRRGLLSGAFTLILLSLGACAWTGVSPVQIAERWTFGIVASVNGHGGFARAVASRTGLDTTTLSLAIVAAAALAGAVLTVRRRSAALLRIDVLTLAGILAVGGMLACYHRHYDNVMLWPALVATIAAADRRRDALALSTAALTLGSLVVPERWIAPLPFHDPIRWAIWGMAAIFLAADAIRGRRATAN